MKLTYGELKELIKDKPDDEVVTIIEITSDNYYYTLSNFMLDGDLVLQ